jgi:pimeloyl-ACP methyl ester carboxylesterase
MAGSGNSTAQSVLVLVPGFWLGAWGWDQVAGLLRDDGYAVHALTLPGLESQSADRSAVALEDHIMAVTEAVAGFASSGSPVCLVGHSGAGAVVYGATDRLAARGNTPLRRVIYVDSGPLPDGAELSPGLDPAVVELPLPSWPELEAAGSSLTGLDEAMLARFREQAVPHPAGPARDPLRLSTTERLRTPVMLVSSSFPLDQVKAMIAAGHPFFAELNDLDVTYIELSTGHWPMWSRPHDLAAILGEEASRRAPD